MREGTAHWDPQVWVTIISSKKKKLTWGFEFRKCNPSNRLHVVEKVSDRVEHENEIQIAG